MDGRVGWWVGGWVSTVGIGANALTNARSQQQGACVLYTTASKRVHKLLQHRKPQPPTHTPGALGQH